MLYEVITTDGARYSLVIARKHDEAISIGTISQRLLRASLLATGCWLLAVSSWLAHANRSPVIFYRGVLGAKRGLARKQFVRVLDPRQRLYFSEN